MPSRNQSSSRRKQKLKDAKLGKKSGSTLACCGRLVSCAARVFLVVFLFRVVVLRDANGLADKQGKPTTSGGGAGPAAGKPDPPKDAPPKLPPPDSTPQKPALPSTLRTWEWKHDEGDPLKFSQDTQLPPYQRIVLLGDSTMSDIGVSVHHQWAQIFPTAGYPSKSLECKKASFFNLREPFVWTPPDFSKGEGPAVEKAPFCSDCRKCKNAKMDSGIGSPYAWEYIHVDFARDVATPSTTTKTTQETVELYLKSKPSNARLCIMNNGLYDMKIPGITIELFLKNLEDYLHRVAPHCTSIVWLSITATKIQPSTDPKTPQSNVQIQQWNTAIQQMLAKDPLLAPKVVFVDLWQASITGSHQDLIHMQRSSWYIPLAEIFTKPIAVAAKK